MGVFGVFTRVELAAVPKMDDQGTCAALEVRWLWPTITKETVQLKFAP